MTQDDFYKRLAEWEDDLKSCIGNSMSCSVKCYKDLRTKKLIAEIRKMRGRIEEKNEALKFYAYNESYGAVARRAIGNEMEKL